MISIENINKTFLKSNSFSLLKKNVETVHAVNNVSFKCNPGRILALLGPNGAGKTTTLRMLSTVLSPDEGSILYKGNNIEDLKMQYRNSIGFLSGTVGLYERLTPSEYIDFFASIYNCDIKKRNERKKELFCLLQLTKYKDVIISKLSHGNKQKTAIAKALVHDPEIIIFDEPTSGLDVIVAQNILDLIQSFKNTNKIVVYSTHIMGEVELLADDVIIINQGKIVFNNTFTELKEHMVTESLTKEFIKIVSDN